MEENKEKVLDLTKIIPALVKEWKIYALATVGVVLFSLVFVFTIPRYYKCKVMLAPESTDSKSGLSSLMSSFGLDNMDSSDDAISPMLYPDLMESRDFIVSLFSVQVTTKDNSVSTTYYDYIKRHNKSSWYMAIVNQIVQSLQKKDTPVVAPKTGKKLSPSFMLSKEQDDIAQAISGMIKYDYDKKTGVVTVTVNDQDPLVCALIADTVSARLQDFITEYRTKKARKDLEYAEKIYTVAKAEYDESYAVYAAAVDANWDIVNESTKAQIKKLENDKDLKYQTLSAINQKLQTSKAKLQEDTPVITMLQGASVPIKPAGPKRMIITLALMVLTFMGISLYVLEKDFRL